MSYDQRSTHQDLRFVTDPLLPVETDAVKCASLSRQLLRLLQSQERRGWDGGRLSGRFESRRAGRMLGGSENVFKRRWEAEGINTAVSILIDGSSSMDGERIRAAQSLTLALADIIEKTGSEYEINVFQSGNEESAGRAREERDIHGSYGSSTPKTAAAAVLIEVKGWAQRKAERQHLQMIARLTNGGTPDYSALHNVVRGISTRPEQRKIVIVLTDGFGDVADVRRTCEAAEKMGINVLAFGLMTENIERVYPNSVAVASLDGLDEAALNRVVATLQKTESKRRLF